ncbi:hypothetical protein AB4Z46_19075 [Variovorax sp. M-6]|uniref:hypothetical protein n=1 Tax=Variovorax sp. M-6 TaxID=3233041 RepID=UPI003F9B4A58
MTRSRRDLKPDACLSDLNTGIAQFFEGGRLVDQMDRVKVLKIDRGILLGGLEQHSGKLPTRQTWWCLPGLLDNLTST